MNNKESKDEVEDSTKCHQPQHSIVYPADCRSNLSEDDACYPRLLHETDPANEASVENDKRHCIYLANPNMNELLHNIFNASKMGQLMQVKVMDWNDPNDQPDNEWADFYRELEFDRMNEERMAMGRLQREHQLLATCRCRKTAHPMRFVPRPRISKMYLHYLKCHSMVYNRKTNDPHYLKCHSIVYNRKTNDPPNKQSPYKLRRAMSADDLLRFNHKRPRRYRLDSVYLEVLCDKSSMLICK